MPALDTVHATSLPSPTTSDMVVTTPRIHGLQVHIPAGARLKDPEGHVVTSMTITPIPIDRPPFPLPRGVRFPTYFTLQPGGAAIEPVAAGQPEKNIKLIFPNGGRAPAGSRIDFWSYDSKSIGWFVYGQGTVTADGRHIVPDPGVRIKMFTCASVGNPTTAPSPSPPPCNDNCQDGDPVDLATGLFVYEKVDLVLPDIIPIVLTRTHRSKDPLGRPFGMGATHGYEMFIVGEKIGQSVGQWVDVVLADGARVHYERLPAPNDQIFEHTGTPSVFYKSRLVLHNAESAWRLTLKDGTVYEFRVDWAPEIVVLKSITDRFGNKLTILRDVDRRITKLFSPNGRWVEFSYNGSDPKITQARDSLGRTVGYTYDGSGRLWKVTDVNNGVTEFGYNASNHIATIKDPRNITYLTNQYDASGRVSRQIQADGSVYRFAYTTDLSGKITQTEVTDPRGTVRRVTFHASGYWLTDTRAVGLPEQQTTTLVRETGSNVVESEVDALNRHTTFGYDADRNMTRLTRLANTAQPVETRGTYTTFSQLETMTDPLQHTTTLEYNASGALTSATDPLTHQVTVVPDAAGRPSSMTNFAGTTQFGYDGGDLVSITDARGHTSTRFLDAGGREVSRTDAQGGVTRIEYDVFNNPIRLIDPLQGETVLEYDANGNLRSVTDPRQGRTEFTYNSMDRIETRTDPLLRVQTFAYDANGNLRQVTDRKGQITIYSYDALNRLKMTTWPDGSTTQYTYDAGDRLRQIADSVSGPTTLEYDDLDRLTSESSPRGTVTYGYDAADRRTSMTVAGQTSIIYGYDNADRLTSITQGSTIATLEYDDADRRTALNLPNGVRVEYGYSAVSQITSLTYKVGGVAVGDLTYTYDAAGRRTEVGGSWARTTLPAAVASATYDAANRLRQWGQTTLTYDDNGNLLTAGGRSYGWDGRDRLSAVGGAFTGTFQYDAFGRRIRRTTAGVTTDYLYDGIDAVQELSGGTPTANIMFGPAVDEPLLRTDGTGLRMLVADGLHSVVALLDSSGSVRTQYTYTAYGQTSATGTPNANAAQYTGRENDETGLYYYRGRYYDPASSRFTSEDPIGFGGGVNLYGYADGNPTTLSDPFGHDAIYISYRGYPVQTPVGRYPLGHGAVIAVDERTGRTTYYEYGRYDPQQLGEVRRRTVPDVQIGPDGRPTPQSLQRLYDYISEHYGRNSPVDATYYDDADAQRVVDFAERRRRDRNREPYGLLGNNCFTFAREAIQAGRRR
jgi:RHS repeat-associated protein